MITASKITLIVPGIVLCALLSSGCDRGPSSTASLVLPEGDAAAGEAAFVGLHCNDCHSIAGREDLDNQHEPIMRVQLGGVTTHITTYGELVTSIINPSHKISRRYQKAPYARDGASEMRNYNDLMTVSQLNNLVTFLQAQYELQPYVGPSYTSYYP